MLELKLVCLFWHFHRNNGSGILNYLLINFFQDVLNSTMDICQLSYPAKRLSIRNRKCNLFMQKKNYPKMNPNPKTAPPTCPPTSFMLTWNSQHATVNERRGILVCLFCLFSFISLQLSALIFNLILNLP